VTAVADRKKELMKMTDEVELTIVLSGGLIQDVLLKGGRPGMNVIVMDYDVEGFDEDEELFRDPEENEYHEIEWGSPSTWKGYREEGNGTTEPHRNVAEWWQGLPLEERRDIANKWMNPGVGVCSTSCLKVLFLSVDSPGPFFSFRNMII